MTDLPRLLTLAEAARQLGVTQSMLSTEIKHGRLACLRIAGKRRLTEQQIREWIDQCHGQQSPPALSSDAPTPAAATVRTHGSSLTEDERSAQAAALRTARALSRRSKPTSQPNTSRPAENVISLGSGSQT